MSFAIPPIAEDDRGSAHFSEVSFGSDSGSGSFKSWDNFSSSITSVNSANKSRLSIKSQESIKRNKRVSQAHFSSDEFKSTSSARESSRTLLNSEKQDTVVAASRLRFEELGLVGRETEKKVLLDCLNRVASDESSRELVLLHGESGSGKTAVSLSVAGEVQQKNGLLSSGKFNSDRITTPYTAIASVCNQICDEISSLEIDDMPRSTEIQRLLSENLGPCMPLLRNIVPALDNVVEDDDSVQSKELKMQQSLGNDHVKASLLFAFRTFLRIASENICPLMIVLDDLQWSDTASLEVLEAILNDPSVKKLFLICTYRDEEMNESQPFAKLVKELSKSKEAVRLNITEIKTENLSIENVNEIVMTVLNHDSRETTLPLAELCHRRTLGNAFFTLTFLRKLRDEKFLTFNLGLFKWTWDVQEILENTIATANVAELMQEELRRLPEAAQRRLCQAACLGNSFKLGVMQLVVEEIPATAAFDASKANSSETWLSLSEQRGFIEEQNDVSSRSFQWVHDKVREAALLLMPQEEMIVMKARLGRLLSTKLSTEDAESLLFVIANLLHEGMSAIEEPEPSWRIEMARIDLKAAQKAVSVSAYDSAVKYTGKGIGLLPSNRWESQHYDLTLQLYTLSAETCAMTGEMETLEARLKEVEAQKHIPFTDKLSLYSAKIDGMLGDFDNGSYDEVTDLILFLLSKQGITFPRTKFGRLFAMVMKLLKVKRKCMALTQRDVDSFPEMSPSAIAKSRLLDQLSFAAFRTVDDRRKLLVPLGLLELALFIFEEGLCLYGPMNWSSLCIIFSGILEDFELSGKMAQFSLGVMEQRTYLRSGKAEWIAFFFGRAWLDPLTNFPSRYFSAYELSLSQGDMQNAFLGISSGILVSFQLGRPLRQLERDCRIYAAQTKEHKQETEFVLIEACWVAFSLLLGDESRLKPFFGLEPGTSMKELTELRRNEPGQLILVRILRSRLHSFFGEYETGAKQAIEDGAAYQKENPGAVCNMAHVFSCAQCHYASAIKTGKSKYKRHAKMLHKKISDWRSRGNPNVVHYDMFLDAEAAFLRRDFKSAEKSFRAAKSMATRGGFIHDAALATERYACMLQQWNSCEASYLMREAVRLYSDWGAVAKVSELRKLHADLLFQ